MPKTILKINGYKILTTILVLFLGAIVSVMALLFIALINRECSTQRADMAWYYLRFTPSLETREPRTITVEGLEVTERSIRNYSHTTYVFDGSIFLGIDTMIEKVRGNANSETVPPEETRFGERNIWINKSVSLEIEPRALGSCWGIDAQAPVINDFKLLFNNQEFQNQDISYHGLDQETYTFDFSWEGEHQEIRKFNVFWVTEPELEKLKIQKLKEKAAQTSPFFLL